MRLGTEVGIGCHTSFFSILDQKAYVVDEGGEETLQQFLSTFNEIPLITTQMLREAWPHEHFEDKNPARGTADARTDMSKVEAVPSLTEITLEAAVKQVVEKGSSVDLEQLPWLPGNASHVVDIFRQMEHIPNSARPLLKRALKGMVAIQSPRLDLSKLLLAREEVIELLSSFQLAVETLDLSFNALLSTEDIPAIVAAAPSVRRLVLMGCAAVKQEEVFELLREHRNQLRTLDSILHPTLLTVRKPDSHPYSFTYVARYRYGRIACTSVPLFTPAQIVQALLDLNLWRMHFETPRSTCSEASKHLTKSIERGLCMIGASAFQGAPRPASVLFGRRSVISVPFSSNSVPRGQKDLWLFYDGFLTRNPPPDLGSLTRMEDGYRGWAFLRLTALTNTKEDEDLGRARERTPLTDEYTATVYDLDGFLWRMEKEGRPMPSNDAVRKLREQLNATNPKTNEKWVTFLNQMKLEQVESDYYFGKEDPPGGLGWKFYEEQIEDATGELLGDESPFDGTELSYMYSSWCTD